MATINFTVNFTIPTHEDLTEECVVFYYGVEKVRECYNNTHSVSGVQSWSVTCADYTTGSSHIFNGTINTDLEIDHQCSIRIFVYAVPCCVLGYTDAPLCGSTSYPPVPGSLITNPTIAPYVGSYVHIINPNNLYSQCRRYILGLNNPNSVPIITQIYYQKCPIPDAFACDSNAFPMVINSAFIAIPPALQNSLLNTPIPNGSNINNCLYSNPGVGNLAIGQSYNPPYGVVKICGNFAGAPVLNGGTLLQGVDYNAMTEPNVDCGECCHKCRSYTVTFALDNTCGDAPQYFAYQACDNQYLLTFTQISPGQSITVCAIEGTITWITPCLSTDGGVIYNGLCPY